MEILKNPILEPCVWKVSDFKSENEWTYTFSENQIFELEEAAKKVINKKLAPTSFSKCDFILDSLTKVLNEQLDILQKGRGFIRLRGLDVKKYDSLTIQTIYWGICSYLGVGIPQNSKGELMSGVKDYGDKIISDNPYRDGIRLHRTTAKIDAHTDSCDHVALLCLQRAKQGGESGVISALSIYNEILKNKPEYLDTLCKGFYIDLIGKGKSEKELSSHPIPVFSYYGGKMCSRFNKSQIELGAEKKSGGLDSPSKEAVEYVQFLTVQEDFHLKMMLEEGDIQVLNNRVIYHTRTKVLDHEDPSKKRLLYRVWLNAPQPRPMAPEFANQLNTGERGGVTKRIY
ncbi:hypothetical protein SAR11G3_00810 [Candidatus Pelagibacter sp. IMCC9063]|jgi:hypothetical protein|uniref:TauD/TfdA family dioxygenase n=1 Tax=Pelagibacter sp. (strain IMCC9063) TaxID=1002672 RepID=UPI00020465D9|nr:TauD/TfdA family dioxygenase [Candidatus Pelagibacter sp. IMCC9063]AEA81285.1 hypothetical protein SAR11G3_00810 [Candidatus Pelagibacter sp. IMCC9063]|tara:strand:+ start:460 stop:1488 length:1029 start_codon:yes stop_codon:yes gene_type:complete